jgi:uncharacterized membrane protein YphA (DoxX/SURF4 family)
MEAVIYHGLGLTDIALLLNRVVIGVFFAISGFHKLFYAERHASLVSTMQADGVPLLRVNQWFVPSVEFLCGLSLIVGFASIFAALLLGAICLVATCVDGIKRIPGWKPLDKADWLDDLLYLPEALYGVMLAFVIMAGPGALALDRLVF